MGSKGEQSTELFSIGIQCMELSIADIEESVRDFIGKTDQVYAPSWKYPTVKLHAVQVHQIIDLLRTRGLPAEQHYLELLEILHDRLYYGLLAFLKFLAQMIQIVNPENIDQHRTGLHILDNPFYDPVANCVPCEDNLTTSCSVGLVVRQLRTKLLQLNVNLKEREIRGPTLSKSGRKQVKSTSARRELRSASMATAVQTDECFAQYCDSCVVVQTTLKLIGDTLCDCLRSIGKEDSSLTKTKDDLRAQMFSLSQWKSITKWCDGLREDCNTVVSHVAAVSLTNEETDQRLKTLNLHLDSTLRNHKLALAQNETQRKDLEQELVNERNLKCEMKRRKELTESRCMELEEKLRTNYEALSREAQECTKLEIGLASTEKAYNQLQKNHVELNNSFETIRSELEKQIELRIHHENQVQKLQEELQTKNDELHQLYEAGPLFEVLKNENNILQNTVDQLKKKAATLYQLVKDDKYLIKKHKNEIHRLENLLDKSKTDLESLLSYPDLNGPIQAPDLDPTDILGSMEGQLRANRTRVELLTEQNGRLEKTIEKLRDHLLNQKQASSESSQTQLSGTALMS